MTVLEWLAHINDSHEDSNICIGTMHGGGYVMIAPKSELLEWLRDHPSFIQRNVLKIYYEPEFQKAWVALVEGEEENHYWMREEILRARGEKAPERKLEGINENCAIKLLGAVIKKFLTDLAQYQTLMFHHPPIAKMNELDRLEYEELKRAAQTAAEFLPNNTYAGINRWELHRSVNRKAHKYINMWYTRMFRHVPKDKYTITGHRWSSVQDDKEEDE